MTHPAALSQLQTSIAWLPKAGHRAEEYEDAFAMTTVGAGAVRVAVADGATETAFAGAWARQLAEGFVAAGARGFAAHLEPWRNAWAEDAVAQTAGGAWYATAKAEAGAAAAFLGLTLFPDGTWHAHAVGDCDLFHLRADALCLAWPLDTPEQFHHRPALIDSRPGAPMPELMAHAGTWQPGDTFVLATDAVAAWLLRDGPAQARTLTPAVFPTRVAVARAAGALRNDDLTLLALALPPANAALSYPR